MLIVHVYIMNGMCWECLCARGHGGQKITLGVVPQILLTFTFPPPLSTFSLSL